MRLVLLLIFFDCFSALHAQKADSSLDWKEGEKYRMVSINTTPLLAQLIPFNRTNPRLSGPFNVEFHKFNGNRSFHTSLGMFIVSDGFEVQSDANFNFRIGGEKRKPLNEKWTIYNGWDVYLSAGNFNLIEENLSSDLPMVLAVGPRWSVGYNFIEQVSISVETALIIGLDLNDGIPHFRFIPPVAVNLNFVLPRL